MLSSEACCCATALKAEELKLQLYSWIQRSCSRSSCPHRMHHICGHTAACARRDSTCTATHIWGIAGAVSVGSLLSRLTCDHNPPCPAWCVMMSRGTVVRALLPLMRGQLTQFISPPTTNLHHQLRTNHKPPNCYCTCASLLL